jgi:hypothetical protein
LRLCPEKGQGSSIRSFAQKKGVWNFQALKTPAFIEAAEFQTPFFGQSPFRTESNPGSILAYDFTGGSEHALAQHFRGSYRPARAVGSDRGDSYNQRAGSALDDERK